MTIFRVTAGSVVSLSLLLILLGTGTIVAQDEAEQGSILEGDEAIALLAWKERSLSISVGGKEKQKQFIASLDKMSDKELRIALENLRQEQQIALEAEIAFQTQRLRSVGSAQSYHLSQRSVALNRAYRRSAATFKRFDRGYDRYNNGFHGYRGPGRPRVYVVVGGRF